MSVIETAEYLQVSTKIIAHLLHTGLLAIDDDGQIPLTKIQVVQQRLEQLRSVDLDDTQWKAILQTVRDRQEMALPGAAEGLREAQQMQEERVLGSVRGELVLILGPKPDDFDGLNAANGDTLIRYPDGEVGAVKRTDIQH